MNGYSTELFNILTKKDGPLIWGITAITVLTLGWKFLDKDYNAAMGGCKIYPSTSINVEDDSTDYISHKQTHD